MDILVSGNVKVRVSEIEDITHIYRNMRDSDRNEIWASNHIFPMEALTSGFKNSVLCYTIELDGRAIAMFGCVPNTLIGEEASIWLLATDELSKIRKKFVKQSKAFINLMLEFYPHLMNYVDERNKESIKWLKWCGCQFGDTINYGAEGLPFRFFEFKRS